MANGADNWCLLLINHKQTPMHELHFSPWNIILPSVHNYFPSFQMLLSIRHADSSAKFVCALQQVAHWLLWTGQQSLKKKLFLNGICHILMWSRCQDFTLMKWLCQPSNSTSPISNRNCPGKFCHPKLVFLVHTRYLWGLFDIHQGI
jgi:hypothetical protein